MLFRDSESICRCKLVVCVKRRRMATRASFALKYFLSAFGQSVKLVRIRRGLERIDVQRQRIKLLVAVARLRRRVGQLAEVFSIRNEIAVAPEQLSVLIERGITHEVPDRAMADKPSVIQITPVFDPDQVRQLRCITNARPLPNDDSRGNCPISTRHIVQRHEVLGRIGLDPGGAVTYSRLNAKL